MLQIYFNFNKSYDAYTLTEIAYFLRVHSWIEVSERERESILRDTLGCDQLRVVLTLQP